jgi:sugar phosphate isomerase/epimerase
MSVGRHAAALRAALATSDVALVLHAPDSLSVGTPGHDLAFEGLLRYAKAAGAHVVVYHGLNFPARRRTSMPRLDRAWLEERSLERLAALAEELGILVAVENLAPVYPGPAQLCHDPLNVRDLVLRLECPWVRMCLDVGHANIAADIAGVDLRALAEPVLPAVGLFHVHDNLGARRRGQTVPGIDPLRLDLHLAPGAGAVAWHRLGELLLEHRAPLLLEVHPPHRPEPLSLLNVTLELLRGDYNSSTASVDHPNRRAPCPRPVKGS